MKYNFRVFLIGSFLFFLFTSVAFSQAAIERPRLVVGIMIDGLQQKHLDLLWSHLDSDGFKKIIQQGTSLSNVSYNIVAAGNSSDIATVMTGTVPYYHGVSGDKRYNRLTDKVQLLIDDDQQGGIGTQEKVSAHNLLASTIVDELMMAFPDGAKSYAVGVNAKEAIMLGGHTAKSVAWINDVDLKWATTGYYKEGLNKCADDMNVNGSFQTLSTWVWKPLRPVVEYLSATKTNKKDGFEYNPTDKKSAKSVETMLKNTPSANSLVTELGLKIISEEGLGVDNVPDIMMLQYTLHVPDEKVFNLQSIEKEDMYLRLDKEIKYFLQRVDSKVGLDRTLIVVFGNQADEHSPSELGNNNIPSGYFSANRSMALVNSYLMAIYGQEKWIKGYYGKNIFLNKKKIEEKDLSFKEIQQAVADFMLEFEGVQSAFPTYQVFAQGSSVGSEMARLRNSTHKNSVGDVVITLMPGWLEVDEKLNPVGNSNSILSYCPLYFYGWQIKSQKVSIPYQVTDIAPTLSVILDIPMPNANIGKPIEQITSGLVR